ncbi:unnamed protein product, partial [Symbiodinium pilosum]
MSDALVAEAIAGELTSTGLASAEVKNGGQEAVDVDAAPKPKPRWYVNKLAAKRKLREQKAATEGRELRAYIKASKGETCSHVTAQADRVIAEIQKTVRDEISQCSVKRSKPAEKPTEKVAQAQDAEKKRSRPVKVEDPEKKRKAEEDKAAKKALAEEKKAKAEQRKLAIADLKEKKAALEAEIKALAATKKPKKSIDDKQVPPTSCEKNPES